MFVLILMFLSLPTLNPCALMLHPIQSLLVSLYMSVKCLHLRWFMFVLTLCVQVFVHSLPTNPQPNTLDLSTATLPIGLLDIPCPLSSPLATAPPLSGVRDQLKAMLQAIGVNKLVHLMASPTKAVSVVLVLMAPRMLLPGVM